MNEIVLESERLLFKKFSEDNRELIYDLNSDDEGTNIHMMMSNMLN